MPGSPAQKPLRKLRDPPCPVPALRPGRQSRPAVAAVPRPYPGGHRTLRPSASELLQPTPSFALFLGALPARGCVPPVPRSPPAPRVRWTPAPLPGGEAANLPGLTVAALPTLARHLSRPPVTSGHLRGGSVPAPEQPGRPFTRRRGAWRCPLPDSRPLGPRVPEGADRH